MHTSTKTNLCSSLAKQSIHFQSAFVKPSLLPSPLPYFIYGNGDGSKVQEISDKAKYRYTFMIVMIIWSKGTEQLLNRYEILVGFFVCEVQKWREMCWSTDEYQHNLQWICFLFFWGVFNKSVNLKLNRLPQYNIIIIHVLGASPTRLLFWLLVLNCFIIIIIIFVIIIIRTGCSIMPCKYQPAPWTWPSVGLLSV